MNHYELLGLSIDADAEAIKSAFKKLALQHHPDRNPDSLEAEELFKGINEAYQVLSNPYKKARYDLKIKYEDLYTQSQEEDISPSYSNASSVPHYSEPPINYRRNWIATFYAFGFTFLVASIIMSGIWINNYFKEKELSEWLRSRREKFEEAQNLKSNGQIEGCLQALISLGNFHPTELDMKKYKTSLLEQITIQGSKAFGDRNYKQALHFYEILDRNDHSMASPLREKMAISYRHSDMPHKSIKIFKELLTIEYRHISTYIQLAEIHRDQLQDYEMSKNYFELAHEIALNYYRAVYGKAFMVLIHEKFLPPNHYDLYTGLAESYLLTGDPAKAIKASAWNLQVWPDSSFTYTLVARSWNKLGDQSKSCAFYTQARLLDSSVTIPSDCL